MSSFDLINLMTLIQNLPLNFDVAFYNWLKILPPTNAPSRLGHVHNFECGKWASLDLHGVKFCIYHRRTHTFLLDPDHHNFLFFLMPQLIALGSSGKTHQHNKPVLQSIGNLF